MTDKSSWPWSDFPNLWGHPTEPIYLKAALPDAPITLVQKVFETHVRVSWWVDGIEQDRTVEFREIESGLWEIVTPEEKDHRS